MTPDAAGVGIIVCGGALASRRLYANCETCQRRTRMVKTYDGPYYGYTTYCYSCMGKEQDGYWMPHRPTQYEEQDKAYIRGLWASALTPRVFDQWVCDYNSEYEAL